MSSTFRSALAATSVCGTGFDWVRPDPGDRWSIARGDHGNSLGRADHLLLGSGSPRVFWRSSMTGDLRPNGSTVPGGQASLGGQRLDPRQSPGASAASTSSGAEPPAICATWYDGRWTGEESLGSQLPIGASPAVSSWAPGRLDVFWRGAAGDLRHKWFANGGWSAEEELGGTLWSDPDAVSWGRTASTCSRAGRREASSSIAGTTTGGRPGGAGRGGNHLVGRRRIAWPKHSRRVLPDPATHCGGARSAARLGRRTSCSAIEGACATLQRPSHRAGAQSTSSCAASSLFQVTLPGPVTVGA